MRIASSVFLILVGCLAAPSAAAQLPADDEHVQLLPLVAETRLKRNKKLLRRADQSLREAARDALGDRALMGRRARSARCVKSARCIGKVAKRAKAARGLGFLLLKGPGDKLTVAYVFANAAGELLLSGERIYEKASLSDGVRDLVRELLEPKSLSALVKVPDVDDEAWVLVDGMAVSPSALAAGLSMSLGQHEVLVLRANAPPERHLITLESEADVSVTIADPPPPVTPEAVVTLPIWPALVGTGVTVVLAGITTAFVIDLITAAADGLGEEGNIRSSEGAALTPAHVARQPDLLKARQAVRTDLLIASGAAIGMLFAGACTAALAGLWALSAAKVGDVASKPSQEVDTLEPPAPERAGQQTPADDRKEQTAGDEKGRM